MSHVTLIDESRETHECAIPHPWIMSHVTLIHEPCHTHKCVTSHTSTNHVNSHFSPEPPHKTIWEVWFCLCLVSYHRKHNTRHVLRAEALRRSRVGGAGVCVVDAECVCDMTHLCVWHGSCMSVTWLIIYGSLRSRRRDSAWDTQQSV